MNGVHGEAMLYLTSFLRLGESSAVQHKIDLDSKERILLCLRILMEPENHVVDIWLKECRSAFAAMVADKMETMNAEAKVKRTVGTRASIHSPRVNCKTLERMLKLLVAYILIAIFFNNKRGA